MSAAAIIRSTWISSGGYEPPVAETMLAGTNYDGYFLEYDSERAGGFEPLRYLPKDNKVVVVRVITSKTGEAGEEGRHQAAAAEAQQIRVAGSARAIAAMRLRLDGRGQHPHRRRAVGQAEAGGRFGNEVWGGRAAVCRPPVFAQRNGSAVVT